MYACRAYKLQLPQAYFQAHQNQRVRAVRARTPRDWCYVRGQEIGATGTQTVYSIDYTMQIGVADNYEHTTQGPASQNARS